jgi:Domain of unknown function (DUF5658)
MRRAGTTDRRQHHLRALWVGSFLHRRRHPRRDGDRSVTAVDWHDRRWLLVVLLVLLLSITDALLTLTVINLGAEEINPLMQPLVTGNGYSFALWKLGMTSAGLIFLTVMARMRTLGGFPIGWLLYGILAVYVLLVGYELWLIEHLTSLSVD